MQNFVVFSEYMNFNLKLTTKLKFTLNLWFRSLLNDSRLVIVACTERLRGEKEKCYGIMFSCKFSALMWLWIMISRVIQDVLYFISFIHEYWIEIIWKSEIHSMYNISSRISGTLQLGLIFKWQWVVRFVLFVITTWGINGIRICFSMITTSGQMDLRSGR